MAISPTAISPTQSNPYDALASMTNPQAAGPGLQPNSPFNFQSVTTPTMNVSAKQATPQGILDILSQHGPQSMTQLLMPLYEQLFGTQAGSLQQQFGQMGQAGMAQAVSDAQKRGLTGSSIEESGIQSALQGANQGYGQAYAGLLSNLVGQYAGAAQQDISGQQNYYQNLAQALGQTYSSNIQQQQFAQQLQAGLQAAQDQSKSAMWAAGIGALGDVGRGAMAGFSDSRLKTDVRKVGEFDGLPVYKFKYRHDKGVNLPDGEYQGFMAHDVYDKHPDCVGVSQGYCIVDYARLFKKYDKVS